MASNWFNRLFPAPLFIESPLKTHELIGFSEIGGTPGGDCFLQVPDLQLAHMQIGGAWQSFDSGLHNLAGKLTESSDDERPLVYFTNLAPCTIKQWRLQPGDSSQQYHAAGRLEFRINKPLYTIEWLDKSRKPLTSHSLKEQFVSAFDRALGKQVNEHKKLLDNLLHLPIKAAELLVPLQNHAILESGIEVISIKFSHLIPVAEHPVDSISQSAEDLSFELVEIESPPARIESRGQNSDRKVFYIAINQKQSGPLSEDDFIKAIENGQVTYHTYVWFPGLKEWQIAGEFPEFLPLLQDAEDKS